VEQEKARLLVQNVSPDAAAALEAEMRR